MDKPTLEQIKKSDAEPIVVKDQGKKVTQGSSSKDIRQFKSVDRAGNKLDGRSIRMTKKLPAYQQESLKSRVHGLGYQEIKGLSSSKQDMDEQFFVRRQT